MPVEDIRAAEHRNSCCSLSNLTFGRNLDSIAHRCLHVDRREAVNTMVELSVGRLVLEDAPRRGVLLSEQ